MGLLIGRVLPVVSHNLVVIILYVGILSLIKTLLDIFSGITMILFRLNLFDESSKAILVELPT